MGAKDKTDTGRSPAANETPSDEVNHSALGGLTWKVLSVGATLAATRLATNAAQRGWRIATGKPVPIAGDYEKERTRDVVTFTALSAMLTAALRVAAERKAADYYRNSTGHLPKALMHESKPSKKDRKAAAKLAKAKEQAVAKLGDAKDAVADKLPG